MEVMKFLSPFSILTFDQLVVDKIVHWKLPVLTASIVREGE